MMELKLKLKNKNDNRKKRGTVTLQSPLFLMMSDKSLIVRLQHHQ
ncbi:hypothetical protein DET54_11396 [Paenibacillus pabuli]|uniref:Uncharacterized protein n=1 Tax=Paenibacillus pabuli TaxID=1472 RepID=A0A855XT59_9BACL|nr:hypothetical protein DET56_107238 [Paenibacillus pabuli]PXW06021.1 hypothetical protein DEU73_107238 [Paenibacillus taichungensis]RAI89813.1 hypothetical protein DET54_11396 [Paenibacillus pabuli]